MFGDDYEVEYRLWRTGHYCIVIPIIAGEHYGSATIEANKVDTYFMPNLKLLNITNAKV